MHVPIWSFRCFDFVSSGIKYLIHLKALEDMIVLEHLVSVTNDYRGFR